MKTQTNLLNPLLNTTYNTIMNLPAPKNISYMWNMGSLLGMTLVMQIMTGILLASFYSTSMSYSYYLISSAMENNFWLIRYLHANGASLFFVMLYLHIGRGLYYSSYMFMHTWSIGVIMLLLIMAAAFLGYVLPVNQMSYWGASVITNLFSEMPYIGPDIVMLIWGNVYVSNPTLSRFFTFHFLIPFIILALVVVHITLLHVTGSSNPLGLKLNHKRPFRPQFNYKDLIGMCFVFYMFYFLVIYSPLSLGDDDNFAPADLAVTPQHIQPEWYFLFAYAILRSIPNKLGGVVALILAVLVLYLPAYLVCPSFKPSAFSPEMKIYFWSFICTVALLTWIGMSPVEDPYVFTGQVLTIYYFMFFIMLNFMSLLKKVYY